MRSLAEILDAFEAELALEQELGVRVFSCDRSLLVPVLSKAGAVASALPARAPRTAGVVRETVPPAPPAAREPAAPKAIPPAEGKTADAPAFVFLHHAPLAPPGVEMMAKIIAALGEKANVPVLFAPPRPKTPYAVVLGGAALQKWFPGVRSEPGRWLKSDDGTWLYVTYSPVYLLRFGDSPQVRRMKRSMWQGLQDLMRRIET